MTKPLRIAVLGAGQMGSGIATLLADAGHCVNIWDLYPEVSKRITINYAPADEGMLVAYGQLERTVAGVDMIFEAIAEDMAEKHKVYRIISGVNPSAIIASNTSSLPASELSSAVENPSRFAIAHFFNPPRIVPLVEIVPTAHTSPEVLQTLTSVLRAAGKHPVTLNKEKPGFVANRLQAALLREAFSLVQEGVASFEDIDMVVRAGLGARWAAAGPMMVTDLGGLDIWKAVTTQLFPLLANDSAPPEAITSRVEKGELGSKTGSGLYGHTQKDDEEVKERILAHFELEFGVH